MSYGSVALTAGRLRNRPDFLHDFPTPGGIAPFNNGFFVADAFVTKLNGSGSLVYSTCIGGPGFDAGHAIAVDPLGQAYITGQDESGTLNVNGLHISAFRRLPVRLRRVRG